MMKFFLTHSPLLYFTQSLWRDEAFSILIAEKPFLFLLRGTGFEPPFYYILLHFWMKLFGNSEIATRSLSLLGLALATLNVIQWAEKLFKKHWLSRFLPLFFFLNPMLLYYGFEVRTYGWFIFFATASIYTYLEKKWRWYIVVTALGFYTHTYLIFVPFTQALHWFFVDGGIKKIRPVSRLIKESAFRSFLAVGGLVTPWLVKVVIESSKLKSSWYFPVNLNLVKSVMGNMFLGYEGTPWYLWKYTAYFSLVLLAFFLFALKPRATRKRNLLFFLMVVVPLTVVIGISFIKPLFVNRYLIPVTIAEVILIVLGLEAVKNKFLQKVLAALLLVFIVVFNLWYPAQHPKLDIRATMVQVNALLGKNDVIFAESPLIFFELEYYSRDRSKVFLYNPSGSAFPWYVGDIAFSQSQMARDLPLYPTRAFLVHENGTFDIVYSVHVSYIPQQTAAKSTKAL